MSFFGQKGPFCLVFIVFHCFPLFSQAVICFPIWINNFIEWIFLIQFWINNLVEWIFSIWFWIEYWIESFFGPIQRKNEFLKRIAAPYSQQENFKQTVTEDRRLVSRSVGFLSKRRIWHFWHFQQFSAPALWEGKRGLALGRYLLLLPF